MDQSATSAQARVVVRGRVQGVGFRMWALRRARALGLSGYARNLADGSVEVVSEGPRAVLERFIFVLRRGPESADVQSAHASWSPYSGAFSRFEIRP
jgi:acylphosphatase